MWNDRGARWFQRNQLILRKKINKKKASSTETELMYVLFFIRYLMLKVRMES